MSLLHIDRHQMFAPEAEYVRSDATAVDPARERCTFGRWEPSLRLIRSIRRYQYWSTHHGLLGRLISKYWVLSHRFWSVVCACDIPLNAKLGEGLVLPHPQGIVIHPQAVIGRNCMIFQQVTIGTGSVPGLPTIGDHVDIGAGARVLGGIRIGNDARIGANAVVLSDVPAGATAVGIPARIVGRQKQEFRSRAPESAWAGSFI
jgi:serine O-acetyltransferase